MSQGRTTATGLDAASGGPELPGKELDWLYRDSPAGRPTDLPVSNRDDALVRASLEPTRFGLPQPPSLLVVGGVGGSGVTTTVLGVAGAMATGADRSISPLCVDATSNGGDLGLRGGDRARPVATMQSWLDAPEPSLPQSLEMACGWTSTGVGLLSRSEEPLPRRETILSVHRNVSDAGAVAIYDGGSPIRAPFVRPLLSDSRIPLVLVVQSSAQAVNRLKPVLAWLDSTFGEFLCSDASIVVSRQTATDDGSCAAYLRGHLDGWVRGVFDIPYDPHLAVGEAISWAQLAEPTRAAYRHLLSELVK